MAKIIRLDQKLANMIAAGEVVEKIANVVKELVENSLDAESTKIDIYLEESGMKRIQVTDNGFGMDEEDALLAFERHATSKIHNEYDLFHIKSLGFRGEALPSIASISRVELETSTGGLNGFKVIYEDGVLTESGLSSPRKGTNIIVSHLFYHTPARFKYLKSPQTELANIVEIINKFSITHPTVSFSLSNQGKQIFQTSGNGNTLDVLAKIYGIEVAKSMRRFSGKNRDYEINGFISNPIQNRSSKAYITIAVNHRMVRNPKITNTIIESYGQLIPLSLYPIVFLNIIVDSSLIDVNIHPTKQEVKFSEEERLQELIKSTIQSKLELVEVIQPAQKSNVFEKHQVELNFSPETRTPNNDDLFMKSFNQEPIIEDPILSVNESLDKHPVPTMDYIGQFHGTYLLFQNQDGLYMLDQHAGAERIRYERYIKRMSTPEKNHYQLLVPMRIELSSSEVIQVSEFIDDISKFGISLTNDTESSFLITQTPAWFPRGYEVVYTEAVLMTFIEHRALNEAEIRDELAKLLACKHSLKANTFITKFEAEQLLHDLYQCDNPYTCPHGRPILVLINQYEVEKWFKRVV